MQIFTDGGCSGNPGPGAWAYVIVEDLLRPEDYGFSNDPSAFIVKEAWGVEKNTTNNRMELQAVISALEALPALGGACVPTHSKLHGIKIELYTDSQYVQKGMTQWIKDWKARGWKTAGKGAVKNQDLWQHLDSLAMDLSITWHWVKGHAGNIYNEHCDSLTQKAIGTLEKKITLE